MRLLAAAAFLLATCLAPAALHSESFDWVGYGKVSVTVPTGWRVVHAKRAFVFVQPTNEGIDLVVEPKKVGPKNAPVASVQFTLLHWPSPLKVEQLKDLLEDLTRKHYATREAVAGSVEKVFD